MAPKSNKTATYETQDAKAADKKLRPYFFSSIGGGVTVQAASQEEANEKAAQIKKNLEENGAPLSPEEAKENSKKKEDSKENSGE